MHSKKIIAAVFASLLVMTAVGCGSKKSENVSASGNAEKQSDGATATTSTEDEGSTTSTSGSYSSTTTSGSGTGSGSGSSGGLAGTGADCLQAASAYAALVIAPLGFAGGASQEDLDKFEQNAADLKAKIPAEVKDDFETLAAAYQDYAEVLKSLDGGSAFSGDNMTKLQDATEKLDDPEVKAAQERIDAYFSTNCGD